MKPALLALHGEALALQLENYGRIAPNRLERRGKQKDLERWILARFLERQAARGHLGFPTSVFESEAPDFLINCNGREHPLEIVEACDPSEQIEWTRRAKMEELRDTPTFHEIDLNNPRRPAEFRNVVVRAINLKSSKNYGSKVNLLIYPNTHYESFETDTWRMAALGTLRDETKVFARVWMLGDRSVLYLGGTLEDAPL